MAAIVAVVRVGLRYAGAQDYVVFVTTAVVVISLWDGHIMIWLSAMSSKLNNRT